MKINQPTKIKAIQILGNHHRNQPAQNSSQSIPVEELQKVKGEKRLICMIDTKGKTSKEVAQEAMGAYQK
ncbi:MAG: hypothetical protein NTZ25_00225 [Candidatus Peregrinibacteria bacterium]|nr:hypothetical protein [Candidatus Peregrinibacteria bacterium]